MSDTWEKLYEVAERELSEKEILIERAVGLLKDEILRTAAVAGETRINRFLDGIVEVLEGRDL